uniref:UBC core domain-containing protein n=1 Tax=viral metagenome TaxID=1070528 RepID=A0A6C0J921_9ZZZZ
MASNSDGLIELTNLETSKEYTKFTITYKNKHINIKYNNYFCIFDSNDIDTDELNISISKESNFDIDLIKKYIMIFFKEKNVKKVDTMNIFKREIEKTKCIVNFTNLKKHFNENKSYISSNIKELQELANSMPKELKLDYNQVYELIIREIKNVNTDLSHSNYICCDKDNYTSFNVRLKYDTGELSEKLKHSKINYFELNFKLNNILYPFVPPEISYIQPYINPNLIIAILNLNNIDSTTWNYTISLNQYIKNISSSLEPYFNTNFDNSIKKEISDIELLLIKLGQMTKISTSDITIKLNSNTKLDKKQNISSNGKYWSSGTGYGSGNSNSEWNILEFLQKQKESNNDILQILQQINQKLTISNFDFNIIFSNDILSNYIKSNFSGLTILELDKKTYIFQEILCILNKITYSVNPKSIPFKFINNIYMSMKDFVEDLINDIYSDETVLSSLNCVTKLLCDDIIKIFNFYKIFQTKITTIIPNGKTTLNVKDQYFDIVSKNQFKYNELHNHHKFIKNKASSIKPKTIMRIVSEFNSLKKNLPNNWDSSILMRVPKSNLNLITFLIVGPKDTPYHNGLFEFHAYFPDNYPQIVPKVLLDTTDGGRVRFNPNLYNCGKVCLSLLGTWAGEVSESWSPQLSTFLQVLISIQSLIFVENPYFNEPGYEKEMNTSKGKTNSFNYTDNIRLETIRVAMNNVLKNINFDESDKSNYNEFIKEHFKLKYIEICKTIEQWVDESTKQKIHMIKAYEEFIELYIKNIDSTILI